MYNGASQAADGSGSLADGASGNTVGSDNAQSLNEFHSLGLLHSQLPQSEVELDNLTEFNTAHNRRIMTLVDAAAAPTRRSRKPYNVHFSEADEVINPEDVDPSVGRFRNLVQETFIPNKVK